MLARSLALCLAALFAFACGAPAAAPAPTPAPATATVAPSPTVTAEPGVLTFQVQTGSKATVRVREQLARVPAPSDAVLETAEVTGTFGLRPDGTFSARSKITVGLDALKSDSSFRDTFIKGQTLETRRFPSADFIPTRTVGLPSPLPASGEWTFKVVGKLAIKGVEKEVTWDVKVKRDSTGITASAKNAPAFTFGDFGMQVPSAASVVSIVDEIRLELDLVAREAR